MALAPRTRIDDLELLEHLADGATADVYRAVDLRTGDQVAIKIPLDAVLTDPRRARTWRREARLTRQLHHPRLVGRVDLGRVPAKPYLAFELLAGGTLRHQLAAPRPIPIDEAVAWARQLAEALDALHAQGLVHADVKPDNALLTLTREVKLADFGAATKMRHLPLAPPRQVLEIAGGTSEYMSPEQIQGRHLDARSDLYSWGVVLYELLTGDCPFTGDTELEVMEAHLRHQPVSVRALRPEVPPGLDAVVLTALRRARERRQPTMAAAIADLDHHLDLDPATRDLSPEPPVELQPLAGSSRLWAFVAAVAISYLAVVAAIIGFTLLVR